MEPPDASRQPRYRYVVIASVLATVLPLLVVGLVASIEPRLLVGLAALLLAATLAGDLAVWRLAGDKLRAQGWRW